MLGLVVEVNYYLLLNGALATYLWYCHHKLYIGT